MTMHTLMTLEFYQENPCTRGAKRELQTSKNRTYNTGDSLVVTDPTTSPAISGLSTRERTGSSVFHYLWSYVEGYAVDWIYMVLDNVYFAGGEHIKPQRMCQMRYAKLAEVKRETDLTPFHNQLRLEFVM